MAKVQVSAAIPDGFDWTYVLEQSFSMIGPSKKQIVYHGDQESSIGITIKGTGFKFDGDDNVTAGKINTITFTYNGPNYVTITGLKISAEALQDLDIYGSSILRPALAGKDTVIGSEGDDYLLGGGGNDKIYGRAGDDDIFGGRGNDLLRGGDGADVFQFTSFSVGKTRILDFDSHGGAGNQDLLDLNGLLFDVEKTGKDTVISSGRIEIVLVGIKPKQIDDSDFVM